MDLSFPILFSGFYLTTSIYFAVQIVPDDQ